MQVKNVFNLVGMLVVSYLAANCQAQEAPEMPDSEIEEVLVVGEQPGPKLWQVANGEHRLYVLAMESPLPKNMEWKSKEVEQIVSTSQEMIIPPTIKIDIGFWGTIGALPAIVGYKNNPDGQKLKDVLSPELYSRWAALKTKYAESDNALEKHRPIFAANELFSKVLDKSGLAPNDFIRWRIEAIVKQYKIPVTHPELQHFMKNAGRKIRKFKSSTLEDTGCFSAFLVRMESDLDGMVARANAWATGDIESILRLPHPEETDACTKAVMSSDFAQEEGLQDIPQMLKEAWVTAAEQALEKNQTTFAYLPIPLVINEDGYLAALKAKGYVVDGLLLSPKAL